MHKQGLFVNSIAIDIGKLLLITCNMINESLRIMFTDQNTQKSQKCSPNEMHGRMCIHPTPCMSHQKHIWHAQRMRCEGFYPPWWQDDCTNTEIEYWTIEIWLVNFEWQWVIQYSNHLQHNMTYWRVCLFVMIPEYEVRFGWKWNVLVLSRI